MKPEIAKIWCDALLSGEYEQCRGVLSCSNKYCCLGVLCELAIKNGVKLDKIIYPHYVVYNGGSMNLPEVVRKWAGIRTSNGTLPKNGKLNTLANMNDTGKSFKSIAKTIKQNVNEL